MMRRSLRINIEVKTSTTPKATKITKHTSKKKNAILGKGIESRDQEDGVTVELNSERMATVLALPTNSRSKKKSVHSEAPPTSNSHTRSLRSRFRAETIGKVADVKSISSLPNPRTSTSTSVAVNSFAGAGQGKTLKTNELLVTEVKSPNKATSALFLTNSSDVMKSPVRPNREYLTFETPPPKLFPQDCDDQSNSDLEMPELDAVSLPDVDVLSDFSTRTSNVISTEPESENTLPQFNPTQLGNRNCVYLVDINLEAYRELENAYGDDYVDIEEFSSAPPVIFTSPLHMQWVEIYCGVLIYICFNSKNVETGYIRLGSKTVKPLQPCNDEYICYSLMDGQITVKSNNFKINSNGQPCLMSIKLFEGCQFTVPKNALYSLENWGEQEASLQFTRVRQSNTPTHVKTDNILEL